MVRKSFLENFRETIRESEINIRLFLIISSCFSYMLLFLAVDIGKSIGIMFHNLITNNGNEKIIYEEIKNPNIYEFLSYLSGYDLTTLFLLMIFIISFFPLSIKKIILKLEKEKHI